MSSAGTADRFSASAPARLDFAGGWTDVPPFSSREGGVVVAGAIDIRAHATVELGGEEIVLRAEDLAEEVRVAGVDAPAMDGRLDLLKAAVRLHPPGPCTLTTRSESPAGSGLGSSGALAVALVAALEAARGARHDAPALAEAGCRLERDEASIAGGKQDQYTAALGGFQRLSFDDPAVRMEPLALDAAFAAELERSIVLCYTGTSRISGRTISRVIAAYERGERGVVAALRGIRDVALEMSGALESADLTAVGSLLTRNWVHQQALDPGMCTAPMASLESAARAAGAIGGKAAGSGAGGSMFFLAPGKAAEVGAAARAQGSTLLPFTWSFDGVRVC